MYVDGQLISTGSGSQLWAHGGDNKIGRNGNTKFHTGDDTSSGESFYGDIDEVRIWNVERTASQISDAKDGALNGDETGLVAYYNFQENSGTTANDSQTLSNNDGTISNATWTSGPDFSNLAYSNSIPEATEQTVTGNEDETLTITLTGNDADGDALTYTVKSEPSHGTVNQDYSCDLDYDGANDYLSINNHTGITSGNDAYTIAAWINPSSMGTRVIVGCGIWGSGNRCNALRLMGSNQIRHYWWGNDLDVTCGDLTDGWHYIVALYDGTTRKVFLDGNLLGSDTPNGHNAIVSNFRIGSTNNSEYFNGLINEVSVWNIGLTQSQIQTIMNNGLNGNEEGLVGYWDFNEGSGTTVTDQSGNGNDGTVNGATWVGSNQDVLLTYDFMLDNWSATGAEHLAVEYRDGASWYPLRDFANTADVPWDTFTDTIPAPEDNIQVRFRAYGENSFNLDGFIVDLSLIHI